MFSVCTYKNIPTFSTITKILGLASNKNFLIFKLAPNKRTT